MGVFVFLPLVLPLSAWPIARLAEQHLHPRTATRLLTAVAGVCALCSTLCLALLVVVGTAQLPGNPLPDGWSDPEVREAVPYDEVAGKTAIPALLGVLVACLRALWRDRRTRRRAVRALAGLRPTSVAVLPDPVPYAYALPVGPAGGRGCRRLGTRCGGRIVVTTGMLSGLAPAERRALFAHERAHLTSRHHRYLLVVRLAELANPALRPLRSAVGYTSERWADEEAAAAVGSRRVVARAIGKAALTSRGVPVPVPGPAAAVGPVPRRVAALLGPTPAVRSWPPLSTTVGLATWCAAAGTTASALSSANSAVTLFLILKAATPL
ncbi:M56 family metallopeptidase [Streptomyces sp. NPDC049906]|uniref:M56 family metallopeptidase n=1 Tax=Streptomyces sp. NPDC049906 TaxID=3155656 RepID=UPI003429D6D1